MNNRGPRSLAEKLTVIGLAAAGVGSLWTLALDYFVLGVFIPPALVVGLVLLAAAGAVASGVRWIPAVGAIVAAGILFGTFQEGVGLQRLTAPESVGLFLANLLTIAGGVLAVVAGVTATVGQTGARRSPEARP